MLKLRVFRVQRCDGLSYVVLWNARGNLTPTYVSKHVGSCYGTVCQLGLGCRTVEQYKEKE